MSQITLPQVVDRLQIHFGQQTSPKLTGPWEMILWENVVYLALARLLRRRVLHPFFSLGSIRIRSGSGKDVGRRAAGRRRTITQQSVIPIQQRCVA